MNILEFQTSIENEILRSGTETICGAVSPIDDYKTSGKKEDTFLNSVLTFVKNKFVQGKFWIK